MPTIHTLVQDIQHYLKSDPDFLQDVGKLLVEHPYKKEREPRLRLSQMGPKCPRALWYSIHHPELEEELPPWAIFKYSFGHMIEAAAIVLAKKCGHHVCGEQDEVSVDGILGHRDCIIDGCIVDVKSAATLSFQKFKDGSIRYNDSFGYLDQLDGYLVGSLDDPLVEVKDRAYLLGIGKELGHMCLYEHLGRPDSIKQRIAQSKEIVGRVSPPDCTCKVVEDGESGNLKLGFPATYNPFKYCCFPHLRKFLYAGDPRYLVKVVKLPKNKDGPIAEVDKHGKRVYN